LFDIAVDMILNPFSIQNMGCIVHPGLSPRATDVEPLPGFSSVVFYCPFYE